MFYPLTVRDFLDRAEHVYPDRIAVVDEPDQPAPSLGELTYRELARARARRRPAWTSSACRSAAASRSSRRTRRGC